MNQLMPIYELGCACRDAYLARRAEVLPGLDGVERRSAVCALVDEYRTALMLIGYSIDEFDADCQEQAELEELLNGD